MCVCVYARMRTRVGACVTHTLAVSMIFKQKKSYNSLIVLSWDSLVCRPSQGSPRSVVVVQLFHICYKLVFV